MPTVLPDFDDPPVIETLLGVEFTSLKGWKVPHFGLFWHEIRADYPKIDIQPPLFDETLARDLRMLEKVIVDLQPHTPVRCWYVTSDDGRLLQLQNNRFIHNWRKTGAEDVYPHFERTRPKFAQEWNRFAAFLKREEIGDPEVTRCEVTYVNQLIKGKEWETLSDLNRIFPPWTGRTTDGWLPEPNAFTLNIRYPIAETGTLTIQIQPPFIRKLDRKEVLQLTVSAHGQPASSDIAGILAWFDLGREWVVRGFADFTSSEMHKLWRRKE